MENGYNPVADHDSVADKTPSTTILEAYLTGRADGILELAEELRPLIAGYFPDMDLLWELNQAVKKLTEGLHETDI